MLGLSEGAINKLYADGVVHRTEPFTEPQVAAVNPQAFSNGRLEWNPATVAPPNDSIWH
jgi:hypothetical protein